MLLKSNIADNIELRGSLLSGPFDISLHSIDDFFQKKFKDLVNMARDGIGIDRATPFTSSEDAALWCLFNNNVRAVGRYYGTAWKRLTSQEALLLAQHGLEIWSVYQGAGNSYSHACN